MESGSTPPIRSDKSHISEQCSRLPEDIIEEILSRLPAKSLLKFRCVSKPWRALIGSKRFIKKHLDTSTNNPNFAHHNIILNSIGRWLKQCSLQSLLSDPSRDQFRFCDLNSNIPCGCICIVGCSNGLVCLLLDSKHFMLWNPSTRKTKKLPAFDHENENRSITSHGFGYDELSGDYMVFAISCHFCTTGAFTAVYKVFSLETNSWKRVEGRYICPFNNQGIASGKVHWSWFSGTSRVIVSFDLKSEVCDVVELPFCSKDFDYNPLGVVGGRLSFICDCFSHLDIWISEYGVKESWEKMATLPYPDDPETSYKLLLAVGPNGEILLTGRSGFGIYYPEGDGFRECHVKLGEFCEAVIYVSLVEFPL